MKIKPWHVIVILVVVLLVVFLLLRGDEDTWIKDKRGVWIKHGMPSSTPDYVLEQQQAIACAFDLYNKEKNKGMNFSSQCLGTCQDYAVDIVYVPRSQEDNKPENQCQAFREGKVSHFIELDKNGEIVRVV
jgi:hypothetical protein